MEIKRNIFESSVKMPPRYENVAVPFTQDDTNEPKLAGAVKTDHHILHARSPRVGDK